MLKRGITILLIICITAANFSVLFVFTGFKMNQKYIAGTLCNNRNKPWMHCNGHCYLMRKIKLAEENEKKQNAKDNLSRLNVGFYQHPFTISFLEPKITAIFHNYYSIYAYQYTSHYIDVIFRPPKAIA